MSMEGAIRAVATAIRIVRMTIALHARRKRIESWQAKSLRIRHNPALDGDPLPRVAHFPFMAPFDKETYKDRMSFSRRQHHIPANLGTPGRPCDQAWSVF
jgi:hypothetical protein